MYVTRYVPNTEYAQVSALSYASYLEKEALLQEGLSADSSRELSAYLDKQNDVVRVEGHEYFFNGSGRTYDSEDVTRSIDANTKGLKKTEAHYYSFSISPSTQEITHLRRTIADTKSALMDAGMSVPVGYEDDMLRGYLKEYCLKNMDAYAQNFGHPEIHSNKDLLWFGMVEKDRYWKSRDKEVRTNADLDRKIRKLERQAEKSYADKSAIQQEIKGLKKKYIRECQVRPGGSQEILRPMMAKAGDNWHIHVTVSRRDSTNSFNLSPNANGRGSKNHTLNGQSVRVGFDREAFKIRCEKIFDQTFCHARLQTESYEKAKELRKESAFVFEKQRLRDLATRKAENLEYAQLKAAGYNEYYESLIQSERMDSQHLSKLKRHIVRQVKQLHPEVNADTLMKYDLEQLQAQYGQVDLEQSGGLPVGVEGLATSGGDYVLSATGLPVHRPLQTVRKVLKKGIMLNRAVDLRRETYDRWFEIYHNSWQQENYLFDSIAERQNMECFLAQTEYLEQQFGASILLENAQEHLVKIERQLVAEYVKENWPDRVEHVLGDYAVEVFGSDGESVRSLADFKEMAQERLLPNQAAEYMQEAAKRSELPRDMVSLRKQIEVQHPDRVVALNAKLETFMAERGQGMNSLREILSDNNLSIAAKEEALMRLAREDKVLDKALRDLRSGLVKTLERQHPGLEYGKLKGMLDNLLDELQQVKILRQGQLSEVVDGFIKESIPNYYVVVERQSELEQLLKEITPDKEKYAERLIEVNSELSSQLSPQVEQLFEQHSRQLFGPEVLLRNEQAFVNYVDTHYSGPQAQQFKESLKNLYARIDEKRKTVMQNYVRQLPSKELDKVRRQQRYIARYINRQRLGATATKNLKEDLQRRVAAACRRTVTPVPVYKVFDQLARKNVVAQVMTKVNQLKMPMVITPQQVIFKAAFKLIGVLTKGY